MDQQDQPPVEHDEKDVARFNSGKHSRGFWWRPEMASASGHAWVSLLILVALIAVCFAAVRFL